MLSEKSQEQYENERAERIRKAISGDDELCSHIKESPTHIFYCDIIAKQGNEIITAPCWGGNDKDRLDAGVNKSNCELLTLKK